VKRRSAFTLTELLVVISIISIVSAITFGVLTRAKHSAKVATTIQNLRSLHQAAMLYQADYGGSTSGTIEEMGLPSCIGTVWKAPTGYIEPFYADLKSPFGTPQRRDYQPFVIPSALDGMPIRWKDCTALKGERCVMYLDQFEDGWDPVTQNLNVQVHYKNKMARGVTLAGNVVIARGYGDYLNQSWWIKPW
jgi:prepilin-type N-terminal cleavage/methylation domain-containing protein